jgi:Transglutaminase-like superfamily
MTRLFLEAYLLLLQLEWEMRRSDLQSLHNIVRGQKVTRSRWRSPASLDALNHAIDLACVFYFKQVLCLQRSAATTLLLRRHGHAAQMVVGAQLVPFKSHAWVEVDAQVVNDKPYVRDIYGELERC